jgi:hypothetical protein
MAEAGPTDHDRVTTLAGPTKGTSPDGKMTEDELKSIIRRELDVALGVDGGKLSTDRRTALEYYEGEPFGNEVEGRSQVVMRSVLETVEWVLPVLLRLFCASDHICQYEPTGGQSLNQQQLAMREAASEQATEYTSYIFYRDNPGFMVLHDWMKDSLIQKLGWVKCYWDTQEVIETNHFTGLSQQEYDALTKEPDVEILNQREYPAPALGSFQGDAPDPGQAMLYDLELRITRREGRVRIDNVPPEEVLVSRRAKRGRPLPFLCHRSAKTWTDLIEMGYDPEKLKRIQTYDEQQYNTERIVRYEQEDDWPYATERTDQAMLELWVEECYLKVDWDGDGRAELRKVTTAGGAREILDNEEIDEVPLIPLCPVPMPHKLVGMSVADLVMDLQLIKSVLMRQCLDNLYLTNNPRHIVAEPKATENTYDDILTSRPGGLIRAQTTDAVVPVTTPFVAAATQPVLEYLDQVAEVRTGISRHNQGLNPDDLNKTATGVSLIQQAAAQRVELIGRIFAETGIKELCRRILGLVTRYQQHERVIRLTGRWIPMDPRQWRHNMEVAVDVGLGTGNRDQILQHLQQILQVQAQIVAQQKGLGGPLVTAQNIFDVLEALTENAGFKQKFFTDPRQAPPGAGQQQQPDPEMMKAHAQVASQQMQTQAQIQADQARAQLEMQTLKQKAQLEIELQQMRVSADLELEKQKAAHAMQLEEMKLAAKSRLEEATLAAKVNAGAFTPPPAPAAPVPGPVGP